MKSLHWLVFLLILLTMATIVSYERYMNETIMVDISSGHSLDIGSDAKSNNGSSSAELLDQGDSIELHCALRSHQYPYPYCDIGMSLGAAPLGINLSQFSSVTLDLSIDGPKDPFIRVYLIQSVPVRSSKPQYLHDKYNQIEFKPNFYDNKVEVPLSLFRPAQWWLEQTNTDLLNSGSELTNIIAVRVSTGQGAVDGDYVIRINSIAFNGKLISRANLYLCIILAWAVAGALITYFSFQSAKKQLNASHSKAMQLQQVNDALQLQTKSFQQASQRDALTGLFNRAALRDRLPDWMNRVNENQDRLSLVLFDIDHFKSVNDGHGHDIGDEVLVHLAKIVSQSLRHQDLLVRWGGEEFAVFCPQTDVKHAEMMAEKVRKAIESSEWPAELNITASFGVSEYYAWEDIGKFVKRADQALYQSKANGRNTVSVSGLDQLNKA
ncbi:GGDEF domain-containing protein [Echinimonas agarilytica]|uniref:diguanylate cyclase n=1 Tax=Echinimonas agarilytica TaxID=1215918 RepID=A0AA41W7Q4_9GAMM|nr:GGDEF domain-containing protein [Echinimonas agarilytica]MCM2680509.1 GGDEF domain-containing protein [Echinimonas agarilytica]